MSDFQDLLQRLDNAYENRANKTPVSVRRLCKDAADFIELQKDTQHQLNLEIIRLRKSLNLIAWPVHHGIHHASLDVALCQKIAQDTLAIGAHHP